MRKKIFLNIFFAKITCKKLPFSTFYVIVKKKKVLSGKLKPSRPSKCNYINNLLTLFFIKTCPEVLFNTADSTLRAYNYQLDLNFAK